MHTPINESFHQARLLYIEGAHARLMCMCDLSEQIQQGVASAQAWRELQHHVHRLVGTSGALGFAEVSHRAHVLEQAVLARRVPDMTDAFVHLQQAILCMEEEVPSWSDTQSIPW